MVSLLSYCCFYSLLYTLSSGQELLQRKRRWLVFPKGSSLQLVYCFLVSAYGTRDGIFVVNITVGLAWEIPQDFRQLLQKEARPTLDSRHRRQMYSKIEALLDRRGVDGRRCIQRAICEASRVQGRKHSFIHALLHVIFTLPHLKEDSEDYDEHILYKTAEQSDDCQRLYPCPLELLHFN